MASVVLVIAVWSGCAVPRTAIVTGAAATILGGVMIASQEVPPPHDCADATVICPPDIGRAAQAAAAGVGYLVGGMIVLVGLGVLTSGLVGLAQEPAAADPPAPLVQAPVAGFHAAPLTPPPGYRM